MPTSRDSISAGEIIGSITSIALQVSCNSRGVRIYYPEHGTG